MRMLGLTALALTLVASDASAQSTRAFGTWSGFYIGVNAGYSWGHSKSTLSFVDAGTGATLSNAGTSADMDGPLGGGQVGYNWQAGNLLIGFETDFQFTGQKGSSTGICAGGAAPDALVNGVCTPGHIGDTDPFNVGAFPVISTINQKLEWFGTVRGRVGWLVVPTIVTYATGGLAYGRVETENNVSGANIFGVDGTNPSTTVPVSVSFRDAATRVGWALGAGIEGNVGGSWTVKLEYLHIDLGRVSGSFVTPLITNSGALLVSSYNSRITDDILRVGLNYRFASMLP